MFLSALPRERGSDPSWSTDQPVIMFLSALPRERGSDPCVDAGRNHVAVSIRAPPRTRERPIEGVVIAVGPGFYPRSPANEGATIALARSRSLATFLSALPRERGSDLKQPVADAVLEVSIRAPPRTRERPKPWDDERIPLEFLSALPRERGSDVSFPWPTADGAAFLSALPRERGSDAQSHARRLASQVSIRAPPRTRERHA